MSTVTVGCKLPNGIHLDHQGKRVTIKGANSSVVIGGHGLTEGVDKEFWDGWLAEHQDYEPVKQGLIFAQNTTRNAEAEAKEKEGNLSGLEGVDPDKPGAGIKKADKE